MVLDMTEELKPSDRRKATKPIMEKRRRARINNSLNELKVLILEALKKDTSCYSKLEKADILEMTVQHLRSLKHRRANDIHSDTIALANYRAGFNECASEVTRVLMSLECADHQVRAKLINHLASCCQRSTSPQFLPSNGLIPLDTRVDVQPQSTLPVTSPVNIKPMKVLSTDTSQGQLLSGFSTGQVAAILVPTMGTFSSGVSQLSRGLFPVIYRTPEDFGQKSVDFSQQSVKIESEKVWRPF